MKLQAIILNIIVCCFTSLIFTFSVTVAAEKLPESPQVINDLPEVPETPVKEQKKDSEPEPTYKKSSGNKKPLFAKKKPESIKPKTVKPEAVKKDISEKKDSSDQFVKIDFNNVDIAVFVKFISELTGENFIIDDRVKGKVTIISPGKISKKEAYRVFESVLEVHGYTTVKAGEITKIVSSPDARTKSIETKLKAEADSPDDRVVTQLIQLKYANPDEIKRLFSPLVSKNSSVLSYHPTNMLIVTDVYSNIKRLMKIIKAIDVTGLGQEISIIPLEYADAAKFSKLLDSVFKSSSKSKKGSTDKKIQFVADERTNTIIVQASEGETQRIKKLITMLDKEIPRGKEKIHVYYLENATAEDLAKVLQAIPTKGAASLKGGKKKPAVVSGEVKISADKATNSLIIMAEKDEYLILEEIIKKLDIPRAMVYIECLIMEVNIQKQFTLGTEWAVGKETSIRGTDGAVGGGFSGGTGYGNMMNLAGQNPLASGVSTLPEGFSMGVFAAPIEITSGGTTIAFPNLGAIVQAYQTDRDVHFLSTPQLLTTDNQEASITVGSNIPYLTKMGTTSSSETYSNYEYKDVGVSLKVTPQISKDRKVRLKIFQEITKLDSSSTVVADRPTTFKRTIDTTVIVKDKNTVVIGGLIDDSFSKADSKVPCLGDVPLLGWLFKSTFDRKEKSNLFVFLTPHVVITTEDAEAILNKKKKYSDKIEEGLIKLYDEEMDEFEPDSKPIEITE